MSLRPCSACSRHVHDREATCPFCGVELGPAPRRPVPDVSRLSRSARLALGAALAVAALPGCGGSGSNQPPESIAQPYGAPPEDNLPETTPDGGASGETGEGGAPADPGTPAAVYGAPPPPK